MSLSAFLLVLCAAFCHAGWNYFVKRLNGGPELIWLFSLVTVVLYLPLAIVVYVSEPMSFGSREIAVIAGSSALHLAYFLVLQSGYRRGDLSLIYPTARAVGPLLSAVMAVLFLEESFSPQMAVGALAVITGVLFLTGGTGRPVQHAVISIAFGVVAGVVIASYTVWDAYAVSALLIPPLLLDYASSIGRVIVLMPYARRRQPAITRFWATERAAVLAIAVLNPLAYILVLYALTFTPVVYVAPTRELGVLVSVLLGGWLLGEGQLRRRLGWAILIVAGVALLATG